jgi:hypothetical protein
MKLYTEEQLTRYLLDEGIMELSDLANNLVPHIELPSDEEIEKKAPYSTLGWGYEFGMNDGFKKGAKFVIDKIQGNE